ncbi:hypothetical protein MCOR29_005240 [Pyricularia oryzae]|uniref:HTH APSES-type domain-containing protein n=2 Tax=Pyricularia TaxID=48558 RepID=A0ABQ8NW13_PYRGI|nr:hypothetical protein MCOR19_007926 [Pyricularia oryzae]KAI6301614.1 hypothetical protein MCOR33_002893 [Pyricularia grisea]KAI6288407.1 hypothetical protein MCOR26_000009 [Pyricularia oryzae]KAI6320588.1 hypothetical protein MCOR29_005240 [Pyricularia oryzae]KAI6322841.1 hypothetical protein MCOR30_007472 [Pyricularia oryzae]
MVGKSRVPQAIDRTSLKIRDPIPPKQQTQITCIALPQSFDHHHHWRPPLPPERHPRAKPDIIVSPAGYPDPFRLRPPPGQIMVKAAAAAASAPTGPGIYSATYSGIPVYEYQFGVDLKEHVMRRRVDDWINATHILKAAGFDKPARTRILEREVQKDQHEKVQGGYGKYQGTWIPLEAGEALAHRNNIFDRLRPIFEFSPGPDSPPPAPRHTSKPKQPKKPAVPRFNNKARAVAKQAPPPPLHYQPSLHPQDAYENGEMLVDEDDTPDNLTVASASYMAEDDRPDLSHFSTGHRKRKREEPTESMIEQQHRIYGDELLDYFLLSRNQPTPAMRPEPPVNFRPNFPIDADQHTALHWAASMGDVDIIKQLFQFNAQPDSRNVRGETPLMRAVTFTNCYDKQTFPVVLKELFHTINIRDLSGCTAIHHAAILKGGRVHSPTCSRYYLDNILNRLQETQHDPNFVQQLLDAQDNDGNTAVHLAAQRGSSKCIRALLGRGASTDIANNEGMIAADLIKELNASKKLRSVPQRSSSPFAPESARRQVSFRDALAGDVGAMTIGAANSHSNKMTASLKSEAALTVQNRITPLVFEKFHDLARSYEDEFTIKDEAEREATRILSNAQAEHTSLTNKLAELGSQLLPPEQAFGIDGELETVTGKVKAVVCTLNRLHVEGLVERELDASMNGDSNGNTNSIEERLALANELRYLLGEQQMAETEYIEALSMVGTGEKIDQYRRLLKNCLGPLAENLDDNLEELVAIMEEEVSDGMVNSTADGPSSVTNGLVGGETMDLAPPTSAL